MIYGFARQSNGHATIDSKPGQGTSVRLYLPRHHRGAVAGPASAATTAERSATGETVLVVEDEPAVRAVILKMLDEEGYRTLEAVDGPSGLRASCKATSRNRLLVTDVGLFGHERPPACRPGPGEPAPALKFCSSPVMPRALRSPTAFCSLAWK